MTHRELLMTPRFRDDLHYWVRTDRRAAMRLLKIMDAITRDPYSGIGKPEPLRHYERATYSRRLTREHRVVYRVREGRVELLQARHHYE